MLMFTLAISCLTTSNLSIGIYLFQWTYHYRFLCNTVLTALDFTSINSHIHNWALCSLWLRLFILSGAISLLFSNSILGTYQPREFIFQCHIFLPIHTVHGVLMARILKWVVIPFSSGQDFVRTLHQDQPVSAYLTVSLS